MVMGVAYLIPAQISSGMVAFYFLGLLQMVLMASLGATGGEWHPYEFIRNQAAGALVVFAAFLFYAARLDIRQMWWDLWRGISGQPAQGLHPDRWLLAGAIVGMLGLVTWSYMAGMALWLAIVFITMVVVFQLCTARLVAALGLQHATTYVNPSGLLSATLGDRTVGVINLPIMLLQQHVMWYGTQSSSVPMVLQSHKLADSLHWESSRYIGAMLVGAVVGIIAYSCFAMPLFYQHGGLMLSGWYFMGVDIGVYDQAAAQMANPSGAALIARVAVGFGALAMWALMSAHRNLAAWPFHPIGYLMAAGYTSRVTWPGLLVGWMSKTVVSRYGSERLYFTLRPIFIGLLLGELAGEAIWPLVCGMARMAGWTSGM